MNTDEQGCAKTVLAGYFKYGAATLIGGGVWNERNRYN